MMSSLAFMTSFSMSLASIGYAFIDPAENRRAQWLFRHCCVERHFTEVVSIFVHLLGAYPELDLLHRNDSWFALEVEH